MASEPEMNIIRFQLAPVWCSADERGELNGQTQQTLLTEEEIFISLPTYQEDRWLRIVLLNPYTDEEAIDRLFKKIGMLLDSKKPP